MIVSIKPVFAIALFVTILLFAGAARAQSGRGLMHGYIAFEGVAYNDLAQENVHATIELRSITRGDERAYTAQTNEYGAFDLKAVPIGDYKLRISSPGFKPYEIDVYMPSDFSWNLAIKLKKQS